MANMQEQMRLFEAETGQGGPGRGGPTARPPPGPPPFRPPSLARAGAASVQKQYSAAPVISRPSAEEDDVFSTLLKYEKEVRAEKRDKKTSDKDKEKKKEKKIAAPQGAIVAAAPPVRPARPAHMSGIVVPPAPPASAPSTTSGTQVTPDEIRIKARQMVDMVKASQATAIKRVAPPSQNKETEGKKGKKQKKMIRVAGGQVWEDQSLLQWDNNDFRLFAGDLGNDVTDEVLTRTFSRYPSFQKAKVVRDKRSNKGKGYGFISFSNPEDFTKAIKEMDGKYVGSRPIKLRKSNWKDRNVDIVKGKQALKKQMGYKY